MSEGQDFEGSGKLPPHMRAAVSAYIYEHREPGHFLRSVLENDLKESFGRADGINKAAMADWVDWLYWDCPGNTQGSKKVVAEWLGEPTP